MSFSPSCPFLLCLSFSSFPFLFLSSFLFLYSRRSFTAGPGSEAEKLKANPTIPPNRDRICALAQLTSLGSVHRDGAQKAMALGASSDSEFWRLKWSKHGCMNEGRKEGGIEWAKDHIHRGKDREAGRQTYIHCTNARKQIQASSVNGTQENMQALACRQTHFNRSKQTGRQRRHTQTRIERHGLTDRGTDRQLCKLTTRHDMLDVFNPPLTVLLQAHRGTSWEQHNVCISKYPTNSQRLN